jgi:HNH endonuclease
VPVAVRDEVLREVGYKCGNPVCRNILTLQPHHIEWVVDGGTNEATNLLALCGHCHDLHTQGHIPPTAIRHWKGILHAINAAFSRESMDLLLFLFAADVETIFYSGDGLLRFAGLIASGFAEVIDSHYGVGVRYGNSSPTAPPASTHRVRLTEKGRTFVEAWSSGDEDRYRQVLDGRAEVSGPGT